VVHFCIGPRYRLELHYKLAQMEQAYKLVLQVGTMELRELAYKLAVVVGTVAQMVLGIGIEGY